MNFSLKYVSRIQDPSSTPWAVTVLLALFCSIFSFPSSGDTAINFADESICTLDTIDVPKTLIPYIGLNPENQPINLEADEIDLPSSQLLNLKGNAFAIQGARGIYADTIDFNENEMTLEAVNATMYSEHGDRISASALQLDIETRIGSGENVLVQFARRQELKKKNIFSPNSHIFDRGDPKLAFGDNYRGSAKLQENIHDETIVKAKARATADVIFLEGHGRERLRNVRYSRCRSNDDSVMVEAREIVVDHVSGIGIGKDILIRFYGLPILYSPTLSFPINDERKSGLLFPTIGYGDNWGFNIELPYYFNLNPQRDATASMRYMANRGLLASGEYRYIGNNIFGNFNGIARGEFMPDDTEYGDSRYGWSYEHHQNIQRWRSNFSFNADLGYVSDSSYLEDLSDNLQVSSASHIPQRIDVSVDPFDIFLEDENLQIRADISSYQTLDSSLDESDEPYSRVPGLQVNWLKEVVLDHSNRHRYDQYATRYSLLPKIDAEFVSFDHSSDLKTTGSRIDIQPSVSFALMKSYLEIVPKITYAYTAYNVENQPAADPADPSRSIYLFQIDSRIFLERGVSWNSQNYIQTLVPRIAYHYVPFENQDDLPVFDSSSVGFDNIADMFLQDGFWGADRIQNFQGLTLGLSSETYRAEDASTLMNWEVAQKIYFADREVSIDGEDPDTSDFSPLIGSARFNLSSRISTNAFFNWDWDTNSVDNWRAGARYDYDSRRKLGVNYSWKETQTNLELNIDWPIALRWQLGAAALIGNSDDGDDGSYTKVSLGYDACCWAVKMALENRPTDTDDDGVQFLTTFSLKGLGQISSNQLSGGFINAGSFQN